MVGDVAVVVDVFVVVLVRNVYILVAGSHQCFHRLGAEKYSLLLMQTSFKGLKELIFLILL